MVSTKCIKVAWQAIIIIPNTLELCVMNPAYNSLPTRSGIVEIRPDISLYYEVRLVSKSDVNPSRVVLIMGALATSKHFMALADFIAAATGYEVLTYDHRGIGNSVSSARVKLLPQTSELLAQDACMLIDSVWGHGSKVHVYGASMGGMVAQKLAVTLIGNDRLLSLSLAVTGRQYSSVPMSCLGVGFYRTILSWTLPTNRNDMIDMLLPKCFTAEYLNSIDPDTNERLGSLWRRRWIQEYEDWWSLHDLDASAAQCVVASRHWLSDEEVEIIQSSRVPVLVLISRLDGIFSPKYQFALANALAAKMHISDQSGHLGCSNAEFEIYLRVILDNILSVDRI